MKSGDSVTYWENYRSNGKIGGWRKSYYTGLVVKVNAKSVHLKRHIAHPLSDGRYVSYGYESTIRVIPIDRCTPKEAA